MELKALTALLLASACAAFVPASPARSLAAGASLRRRAGAPLRMVFGGNDPEKPKLTREDEPEEFFASSFEDMPVDQKLKDPLVIIGLVSIFFPFALLVVFNAAGMI
mmetsp:Transcript_3668/g.12693  ORF Transcript_3668/g.12693 Transcript_3668/m.12693 type:complete len:107 (-) Transcript_3668:25-345(-)